MMQRYFIVIMCGLTSLLYGQNSITLGPTMYQNQSFSTKDKHIFDSDKTGSRVWDWRNAQGYCRKLIFDGHTDWRVASRSELKALFSSRLHGGLHVKKVIASKMPALGGKYDDVWMWTRDSKGSKLGGFVNFKTAKVGWADKKYKGYVICTRNIKGVLSKQKKAVCKGDARQEVTHSRDWVKAWNNCSGYTALKKDGSLWQFGKVGECSWGGIAPLDPVTGKTVYKEKKIYYLKPKKIGKGFKGAKFINGGYRMYAIQRDGTLWGWGEGFGIEPKKLDSSHNWSDFAVKYEGNGCCGYDVGLKKDGTLWRIPESTFAMGKYKTLFKIEKIGQFHDWKKIVLGCCNIYGLRKNSTMWRFSQMGNEAVHFKKYTPKKEFDGDMELYPLLKSKMSKVRPGSIYSSDPLQKTVKANRDGTLCLPPELVYQ